VAVAVSGGLDSVVLLDLLQRIKGQFGVQLSVATADHGLRPESGDDAAFVRRLAVAHGLPFTCGRLQVGKGRGLEEAARSARLAFLRSLPVQRVALAHHRDDQAETVLLRLLRGAGLDGLGAMEPWHAPFLRPMLDEPRSEILAWAHRRELSWREDASNQRIDRERNRVRQRIMPLLEEVHGGAGARLAGLATALRHDIRLLARLEEGAAQGLEQPWGLDLRQLIAQPPALQNRLIRRLVASRRGDRLGLGWRTVEQARRLAQDGEPGAWVEIPGAWRLTVDRDALRCLPPPPSPLRLQAGLTSWGIYEIEVRPQAADRAGALSLRPPEAGERLGGSSLGERLRAAGIPASLRPYHPVFCLHGEPCWIPPWEPVRELRSGLGLALGVSASIHSGAGGCRWYATL